MTARTTPNPLTIAYMAIGAQRAILKYTQEMPEKMTALVAASGGQLSIIDEVIGHALLADMVGDHIDSLEMQVGVWCYEIEDFGFDLIANHFEPISRRYACDILLDSLCNNQHSRTIIKGALDGIPSKILYAKGV